MNKFVKHTAALLAAAFVFAVGGAYAGADSQTGVISAGAYSAQETAEQTGVRAVVTSETAVLSWNKQSDVKTYSVYSKGEDGSQMLLLNTGDSAVCIADLEPKTQYSFIVTGQADSDDVMIGSVSVETADKSEDEKLDKDISKLIVNGLESKSGIDSVTLDWESTDGILSYNVYRKAANGKLRLLANTYENSITLGGLDSGSDYTFAVKGKAVAKTTKAAEITVSTQQQPQQTDAIENISIEDITVESGYDSVQLSWEKVDGVEKYNVYIGNDRDGYTFAASTDSDRVTVSELDPDTEYSFLIRGQTGGRYTQNSYAVASTLGIETQTITGLEAKPDFYQVSLSWKALKGVDTYNIYVKGKDGTYVYQTYTRQTAITLTGLDNNTEYTYCVKGQVGGRHSQGSEVTTKTPDFTQQNIKDLKAEISEGSVKLSWSKQSGAAGYCIYLKNKYGSYDLKARTAGNSIDFSGLYESTYYTYCVKAFNGSDFTKDSNIVFRSFGIENRKIDDLKAEVTDTTVTLTWSAVIGAESYNVYIRQANGKYKCVKNVSTNSAVISGLKCASSYTFAVRAKKNGRFSERSVISAVTSKKITDVTIKFEKLNQLGGKGNSGKVKATYGCGGTSVTMLLNAKGLNLNKDTVLRKQYKNGWCSAFCPIPFPYGASNWGSLMCNLVELAKSYGFTPKVNTAPTGADIKRVLSGNNLVLVGLRTASGAYHFQIIYGFYIKNGITYFRMHDPYGNYCVVWTEAYLKKRIYSVNMKDWYTKQVRGIMWL